MKRDGRQLLTEWLVLAAQGGDEEAFTRLHALWRADLRRSALIRVQREDAADDVTQDAWLTIARGLRRLDDPACFPRWALRIVERRCADWIRRLQAHRRRVEAVTNEPNDEPPRILFSDTTEVAALRDAIARLTPELRQLLHLFYVADRSVAEIAEVLDVPPGTVKSRLFEVRKTLKHQLEKAKS